MNTEVSELFSTKYIPSDKVFVLFNDEIVEGIIVAITKTVIGTDENGEPLVSDKFVSPQETYTVKLSGGNIWVKTNNVNHLHKSPEEVVTNIKIKYIND